MVRTLSFLQYLPAFLAVARLGSIRGAADELNLSPSAISLQMKKLSEATGIVLFEKAGRTVSLTQAARELAQSVALSLGQLESAVKSAREMDRAQQPISLGVSVPPALGVAWLSGAIVEFAESRQIVT